jgi:hypothetical protein
MKSIGLILIATMFAFGSCSHEEEFTIKDSEVPKDVMAAFKTKYPNAQVKEWEAQKSNGNFVFECEFKDGDKEKEVHITPDGNSIVEEK